MRAGAEEPSVGAGRGQPEGANLRLFVAVELPESWRDGLDRLQAALRDELAPIGLRWTRPEAIHLTLKFLGEVEASRLGDIEAALTALPPLAGLISLRPGRLGSFGGRLRPRVLWLSLDGDLDALRELAAQVDQALVAVDFPAETRPFAAHLTLARVPDGRDPPSRVRISEVAATSPARLEAPAFTIGGLSLMRSQLGPGGARYRRLRLVTLS